MILTLLQVRWLTFKNTLLRSSKLERRRARAGLLVSTLIVIGIGVMTYSFLEPFVLMSLTEPPLQRTLSHLPAFAFFTAFWMLVLSAVTVGIQTFYLNQELPLLLSSPARPRAVFLAKFVEATAANAALFATIGAPMLLAFALVRGSITPPYIIYLALVLVAFAALPTALGILFSFLLMRVLPASRTRDLLAAIGIAVFACFYFAISVSIKRLADVEQVRHGLTWMAGLTGRSVFREGPWAWGGDVLSGDLSGAAAWERIGVLWAVAVVAVGLASQVAGWVHWRGWTSAQETASSGQSAAGPVGPGLERWLWMLAGPTRAVFLKDLRSLRRDMRQLSMLLIPIAVVAVFLLNVTQTPQMERIPAVLLVQTLFLILAPISLRLAMSGFITESRALWVMMSAPGDPVTILRGKFLYAYSLSLPLAIVATVAYGWLMRMSGLEAIACAGLMMCAVAGFCGIGVGSSALFADFSAENPRFVISAGGRMVIFGVQLGYLLLMSAVTVGAWILTTELAVSPAPVFAGAALFVLGAAAVFVFGPIALGARRLRRLEW